MTFCTAINCMDGRAQLPAIEFLRNRFECEYVDVVTEPGPNRILAEGTDEAKIRSMLERLRVSLDAHRSKGVAIVGHHDCAGNPSPFEEQREHLRRAVRFLRERTENVEVVGLWIDEAGKVRELSFPDEA